jgi:hypothetical protein
MSSHTDALNENCRLGIAALRVGIVEGAMRIEGALLDKKQRLIERTLEPAIADG